MFLNHGKLNHYLNRYFNNIGLRYLDKEEFFKFIKKCVIDFRVKRNSIPYFKYTGQKNKLFDNLWRKFPTMKKYDISLLCELVDKSKEKDSIYSAFGLDKPEKEKIKKSEKKQKNTDRVSVKDFLKNNFTLTQE
jgi:hypothetical protein